MKNTRINKTVFAGARQLSHDEMKKVLGGGLNEEPYDTALCSCGPGTAQSVHGTTDQEVRQNFDDSNCTEPIVTCYPYHPGPLD